MKLPRPLDGLLFVVTAGGALRAIALEVDEALRGGLPRPASVGTALAMEAAAGGIAQGRGGFR